MLSAPCLLMSDAHLGAAPSDREREVAAFLAFARTNAASVVINGDLFDFWFEWRTVMPRGHVRVLGALAALADAGIPVMMVAGNHDAWAGDVLAEEVGVTARARRLGWIARRLARARGARQWTAASARTGATAGCSA